MTCDICHEIGHHEYSCLSLWRTYVPDGSKLRKVQAVPVSCYSCGSNRHYGLDCDLRSKYGQSGPTQTTFSWKNAEMYIDSNSPLLAISLSGVRHLSAPRNQYRPPEPTNTDVDTDFFRPRITRDEGSRRHIRFANNEFSRGQYFDNVVVSDRGGVAPFPSYNHQVVGRGDDHYAPDHRPKKRKPPPQQHGPNPQQRGPGQGGSRGGRPTSGPGSNNFARGSQRSRGGPPTIHLRGREVPRVDTYEPMPSAAKKAWSRYRA